MSRPEPTCPYCAEPIEAGVERCPCCGELLAPELPERSDGPTIGVLLTVAAIGCFCVAMIAVTAVSNLLQDRPKSNEAAAIGALRSLVSANEVYREVRSGKDRRYAPDLEALGDERLIDEVLASGRRLDYRYQLVSGSEDPSRYWMAVAYPALPKAEGDRYFAINHQGVVHYRTDRPFELDEVRCEIEGGTPIR